MARPLGFPVAIPAEIHPPLSSPPPTPSPLLARPGVADNGKAARLHHRHPRRDPSSFLFSSSYVHPSDGTSGRGRQRQSRGFVIVFSRRRSRRAPSSALPIPSPVLISSEVLCRHCVADSDTRGKPGDSSPPVIPVFSIRRPLDISTAQFARRNKERRCPHRSFP
jgi:hypothetical protein